MTKVHVQLLVILLCWINDGDGSQALKISKRSAARETMPGGYVLPTPVTGLSPSPSSPRDTHVLRFSATTAPLRREALHHTVGFPVLLPLQDDVNPSGGDTGVATSGFSWSVDDPPSRNNYGHQESRSGDNVEGSYYALLPDGRVQRVDYHVDPTSGYVAKIRYNQTEGSPASENLDHGEGREDKPEIQMPLEETGSVGNDTKLDTIPSGIGTSITFDDEKPVSSAPKDGNQESSDGDDSVDSVNDMPDFNGTENGGNRQETIEGESTDSDAGSSQPSSTSEPLDSVDVPSASGGQESDYSDAELHILLNEALKNYTDIEDSLLPNNSNPSDHDFPSFIGNEPDPVSRPPGSFPVFPDVNLSDIFSLGSSPLDGFDPKFPPPPDFIPLDFNDLSNPFQDLDLIVTY